VLALESAVYNGVDLLSVLHGPIFRLIPGFPERADSRDQGAGEVKEHGGIGLGESAGRRALERKSSWAVFPFPRQIL